MLLHFLLLILTGCIHLACCTNVTQLADAVNDFAFRYYQALPKEGNVIFSPMSISTALAMTYLGAGGNTAKEIETALGFEGVKLKGRAVHEAFRSILSTVSRTPWDFELDMANSALVQKGLNVHSQFAQDITRYYEANLKVVDFTTQAKEIQQDINEWVSQKTKQKIPKLLDDPPSQDSVLYLLNAVYFKGQWLNRFNPGNTKPLPFYGDKGSTVTTPMMHQSKIKLHSTYIRNIDADVVELPYIGGRISALLVVPRKKEAGLAQVNKYLNAESFRLVQSKLTQSPVELLLPRINFTKGGDIREPLQTIGLVSPFESGMADFSGISGVDGIFISKVVHKVAVEVNEEGTMAAASTGVEFVFRSGRYTRTVKADHPFLFLIMDKLNGMILFVCRVSQVDST